MPHMTWDIYRVQVVPPNLHTKYLVQVEGEFPTLSIWPQTKFADSPFAASPGSPVANRAYKFG